MCSYFLNCFACQLPKKAGSKRPVETAKPKPPPKKKRFTGANEEIESDSDFEEE